MNMDIIALWGDFNKENTPPEGFGILAYLQEEFKFDEQEVKDLMQIANAAIAEFFDLKQFEKKKNRENFHSMVGMFMMAFFFGMYLEQNEHWNWPNKK